MNIQDDASRISHLIEKQELAKALWILRDAMARSPGDLRLLELASNLADTAKSAAIGAACNKATDGSRHATELARIEREARQYLLPST
jgi:hypothetical protein